MGAKPIATAAALAMGFGALSASTALAGQAGESAAGAAQPKAAREDTSRRVCRNVVVSGTRLSRRSCRTARAWEEDVDAAQRLQSDSAYDGQYRDGTGQTAGGPPR